MNLNIIGVGACLPEDMIDGEPPYKDYMPKQISRMSSRFARMVYVAVSRALKDAGYENDKSIPIITATSLGEADDTRELLTQIFETQGETISPKLVQNTVYNAPTSVLTIGMENKNQAITITHSFLSIESAIDYAFTLLSTSENRKVIVVGGEQYLEKWENMLEQYNLLDIKQSIKSMDFKEGVIAFILSLDKSENKNYGEIINSCVVHIPTNKDFSLEILNKYGFSISENTKIIVRKYCQDKIKSTSSLSKSLKISENRIIQSTSSMSEPLYSILMAIKNCEKSNLLFISSEVNDIGLMQANIIG
jgi:hypothetical protein